MRPREVLTHRPWFDKLTMRAKSLKTRGLILKPVEELPSCNCLVDRPFH